MSKSRRFVSSFLIAAHLVFAIVGCAPSQLTLDDPSRLEGEEIFNGVFFARGELGEELSHLFYGDAVNRAKVVGLTAEEEQVVTEFQDQLIAEIQATHPKFFTWFQEVMQAGDPVMVEMAVGRASDYTIEAFRALYPDVIASIEATISDPNSRAGLLNELRTTAATLSQESGETYPEIDDSTIDLLADALGMEASNGAVTKSGTSRLLDGELAKIRSNGGRYKACSLVFVCVIAVYLAAYYQVAVVHDLAAALVVAVVIAISQYIELYLPVPHEQVDPFESEDYPWGAKYAPRQGRMIRDLTELLHYES